MTSYRRSLLSVLWLDATHTHGANAVDTMIDRSRMLSTLDTEGDVKHAGDPAAEADGRLIFPALDHGFVEILDVMGNDRAVEESARVSYQSAGKKRDSDTRTLLRYMLSHRHTSPFERCEIVIRVRLPVFVERQWARHRTASWNEVSARYSVLPADFYLPDIDQVRAQSKTNKQGRADPLDRDIAESFLVELGGIYGHAYQAYEAHLEAGVTRELARLNLPVGIYTEKVWKVDLHNLMHFLRLRLDEHAQYEVRVYAQILADFVRAWVPHTWEAFVDYELQAVRLSRMEVDALRSHVLGGFSLDMQINTLRAYRVGLERNGCTKREIGEAIGKLFSAEAIEAEKSQPDPF